MLSKYHIEANGYKSPTRTDAARQPLPARGRAATRLQASSQLDLEALDSLRFSRLHRRQRQRPLDAASGSRYSNAVHRRLTSAPPTVGAPSVRPPGMTICSDESERKTGGERVGLTLIRKSGAARRQNPKIAVVSGGRGGLRRCLQGRRPQGARRLPRRAKNHRFRHLRRPLGGLHPGRFPCQRHHPRRDDPGAGRHEQALRPAPPRRLLQAEPARVRLAAGEVPLRPVDLPSERRLGLRARAPRAAGEPWVRRSASSCRSRPTPTSRRCPCVCSSTSPEA